MTDIPPLLVLTLLVGVIIVGTFMTPPVKIETKPTISVSMETVSDTQLIIIRGNSVVALNSPMSNEEILASLTPLEKRIVFCESSNISTRVNPISKATGWFQVIPTSEKFCERGLKRPLNMKNQIDNIDCAHYLMKHGGLKHWSESRHCWGR